MATVKRTAGPAAQILATALTQLQGVSGKVGWFESSKYNPSGTSVAYVAAIQEFGATINVKAHEQTIYRSIDKSGEFRNGGKFTKASKSNFASTHSVGGHAIVIPPRLGLRQMSKAKRAAWAGVAETGAKRVLAGKATATDMMELLGAVAEADMRKQIASVTEPPLAVSTLAKRQAKLSRGKLTKTGSKPENDTGYLLATVTHVVGPEQSE